MRRTGLSTFLGACHRLCVLFGVWEPRIVQAIQDNQNATPEQKATLINAINVIKGACSAVDATRVIWER